NIKSFILTLLPILKTLHGVVIVVDSKSTDKTLSIVSQLAKRYPKLISYLTTPKGLGVSLTSGLNYAARKFHPDILITLEADMSNDPKQIPQFIRALKTRDIVLGSRYVHGGKVKNWSLWRKGLSFG